MSAFEKAPVVVLSSIDWDAAWQRHQIFAAQFAAAGHRVFFVENTGFRNPRLSDLSRLWAKLGRLTWRSGTGTHNEVPEGVTIVPARMLPPGWALFRWLNELVLIPQLHGLLQNRGLATPPIVIAYFPTATTLVLMDRLGAGVTLYDCASNFRAHPSAPSDLPTLERGLLDRSDGVVCDSDFLYRQKKAEHSDVAQIHQGVPDAFFSARPPRGAWDNAVYYGTWSKDLEPALLAAACRAGLKVTVSGFTKGAVEPLPPGVTRLAPAAREKLVERLEAFDVLLLPYRINPFLLGVVPAKIYECLAMGRPIVATPLPSLKPLEGLLYLASTPEEWELVCRDLPRLETPEKRQARIAEARRHAHSAEFARFYEFARERWGRRVRAAKPVPWWASPRLQDFVEGFGWIGALYGLARVSTLATQALAGRLLGPAEFGRANLVMAAAAFAQIVPILGFPLALSKFPAVLSDEERRSAFVSTSIAVFSIWALLGAGLLRLVGPALGALWGLDHDLLAPAALLAYSTAVYTVLASPLLGLKRFAERGVAETIYGLSAPLLLLLCWRFSGRDYRTLIVALCGSLLLSTAYAVWTQRALLRPRWDASALPPLLGYAAGGSLALLTTALIYSPARLMLAAQGQPHAVGLFSAYFTATAQVSLAFLNIGAAVVVPLASTVEGQRQARAGLRRIAAPMTAAAFVGLCLAAYAALLAFGRQYELHAYWIALFAAAGSLILLHGLTGAILAARDADGLRLSALGHAAAGAANIGLTRALVPRWGVPGAAGALVGAYLLGLLVYAASPRLLPRQASKC